MLDANSDLEMLGFDSKATPAANGVNHKFREAKNRAHPTRIGIRTHRRPFRSSARQKTGSCRKFRSVKQRRKLRSMCTCGGGCEASGCAGAAPSGGRSTYRAAPFRREAPTRLVREAAHEARRQGCGALPSYLSPSHPERSVSPVDCGESIPAVGRGQLWSRRADAARAAPCGHQAAEGIPRAKKGAAAAAAPVESLAADHV